MSENLNYTTGNIPVPVSSGTEKKKRKHIFGKVFLTLLVLIVIAAGVLLYFHPGIIYTAKAYTAIRAYLSQERYAAVVDTDLQAGSASAHLDTVLVKTSEEDLDVYALLLDGGTVYIADKGLFLSDGSAYSLPELAPDVFADLDIIKKLMVADRVTKVGSENGADTYRIGTAGEEALSLLRELVPDLADRLSSVNEAYLTITVQEKTLTEARIDASGRFKEGVDVNISVSLSDTPIDSSYTVSEDLISRIHNMKRRDGVKLLRDLFRFYVSWSRFEASDPRAANVVIGAKCGLLNFKTSFDWCGRHEDGNWVDYFIKDGRIVYQTVNDSAEENTSAENQTMVIAVKLFGLAYELCRQDSGGYTEQDGKYIYSAELSEEMMDLILNSVFPSAQRMNVTLNSGNMELVLGDYTVESVSLNIEGTVRVLVFDLPVDVNAVLTVIEGYELPD